MGYAASLVVNAVPWLILLSPAYAGLAVWLFRPEGRRRIARWRPGRVVALWAATPAVVTALLMAAGAAAPYMTPDPARPGARLLSWAAALLGGGALSAAVVLPAALLAASYVWRRGRAAGEGPPRRAPAGGV